MRKYIFSCIIILGSILNGGYAQTRRGIATIQFAGSIGYISMGGGITSKSQKLHNELLYGFVPGHYGGPLNKLSYKLTYYPFQKKLSERVAWVPFSIGGTLAYNLDNSYSLMPSYKKYDRDYYWWSSGLRKHLTMSTTMKVSPHSYKDKHLLFYLEANTNDLYVLTLWDNIGQMKFTDIWFLGIGVKSVF